MVEELWNTASGLDGGGRAGLREKWGGESELAGLALRGTAAFVSSSMTSFTQCSGTSFTLPHERSPRGSAIENDLEECGRSGTAGAFCGGAERGEKDFRTLCQSSISRGHGIFMAAALPGTGAGGHRERSRRPHLSPGKPQTSGNSKWWNCGSVIRTGSA